MAPASAPANPAQSTMAKTHDFEAEIVAYDAATQTLTIKGTPDNKTVPVDAAAVAAVKGLKPGQKVTLICRDNETGEHRAVAGVKVSPDKAPAKMDEKK